MVTLPMFNSSPPEKWWLEDKPLLFGWYIFRGELLNFQGDISDHSNLQLDPGGEPHGSAGANCMLEYKLDEATELLRTNESNARTTLKSLEEDEQNPQGEMA